MNTLFISRGSFHGHSTSSDGYETDFFQILFFMFSNNDRKLCSLLSNKSKQKINVDCYNQ